MQRLNFKLHISAFILSALMLAVQTSALLHGIDHHTHDEVASCDLIVIAEKLGTITAPSVPAFAPLTLTDGFRPAAPYFNHSATFLTPNARAPPKFYS